MVIINGLDGVIDAPEMCLDYMVSGILLQRTIGFMSIYQWHSKAFVRNNIGVSQNGGRFIKFYINDLTWM